VSKTLTVQTPVSDELIAGAGGLPFLLRSVVGRIVSTPTVPPVAEAGPWRAELVFHSLLPGTWVTGPRYSQVEAAWTDVPPLRWEAAMVTWVNFRVRVLDPHEDATDTHVDPQP
jgi:hypothetical protein